MKNVVFLLILISCSSIGYSQRKLDIGAFGGTSYYLGDLNPIVPFSNPRVSFGPIIRYNLDTRHSFRIHGIYANVAGADVESNQYDTKRNYPVNFSSNLINAGLQFEFNFFSYETYENPGAWTPYMFGGVAYSVILGSNVEGSSLSTPSHMSIPFGAGIKLNLTRRLSTGLEWSHHKTFTSRFDGVVSPNGETFLFQNDWYSFFGLFITYKFFKFAADCPTYD